MPVMNFCTTSRMRSACFESSSEAVSTSRDAVPVSLAPPFTWAMLLVTSLVPREASATLRAISRVAAACSSTAAAMAVVISSICWMTGGI